MKRLFLAALFAILPITAGADIPIPAGTSASVAQCFNVAVRDTSVTSAWTGKTGLAYNSSGLTCYFHRDNAASATAITLATSTLGSHPGASNGGFKQVDSTNAPGVYQLCLPDAATAVGAYSVSVTCRGVTNMEDVSVRVILISPNSFGYDGKIASESGTTIGLASGAVDADDQFNYQTELVVFDSAGLVSAVTCITDSVNTGDTVVTAEDITALIAVNDNYLVRPSAGCRALRPTVAGRALDVSSGGEGGVDWANVGSPTTSVNLSGTSLGTCTALGATAKSDVKTQMTDALNVDTYSELSACPGYPVTLVTALLYNYQFFRHKMTATSTVQTMFKDNGSTSLCTNTMSDSSGTFTRGEFN